MSNKIYSLETKSWVDNHSGCNDFYEDDLYDNPSVRIPVMFCIDTGKTMFKKLDDGQTKLEKAQETVKTIMNAFSSEGLKKSVDFSVVTFSDDVACDKYFSCTGEHPYEVDLAGKSYSSIGSGVKLAANMLHQRLEEYQQAGVEYKAPFLFLFYGSKADKDDPSIDDAVEMIEQLEEENGLNVFPVNIGNDDSETLGRFASEETFEKYGNIDFENFFNLVSSSVSSISVSQPGIELDVEETDSSAEDAVSEPSEEETSDEFQAISSSFEEINNL